MSRNSTIASSRTSLHTVETWLDGLLTESLFSVLVKTQYSERSAPEGTAFFLSYFNHKTQRGGSVHIIFCEWCVSVEVWVSI
jgi:hypothetical protein